jgi:hypothetical protein
VEIVVAVLFAAGAVLALCAVAGIAIVGSRGLLRRWPSPRLSRLRAARSSARARGPGAAAAPLPAANAAAECRRLSVRAAAGDLRDLAASLGPDAEEAYVTTAEMLRAEGEARSEARWRAEALVGVLTVKFGPLSGRVPKVAHAASIGQIKAWAARAVTADPLDQVIG